MQTKMFFFIAHVGVGVMVGGARPHCICRLQIKIVLYLLGLGCIGGFGASKHHVAPICFLQELQEQFNSTKNLKKIQ